MATVVQRNWRNRVAGALMAPLVVIARARGWRRRGLMTLYAAVVGVVAALAWRAVSLMGLPDVGDPFDVAAFRAEVVPESEDAFTLYRQAIARLKPTTATQDVGRLWGTVRGGWSKASPTLRAWVDENRAALAVWRQGTERARAMPVAPRDIAFDAWTHSREFRDAFTAFAFMALLEGSRLQESGDLAGAWGWYNAALRASRHIGMHAPVDYRTTGLMIHNLATERVAPWASDPKASAAMLRQALDDFLAIGAMARPNSDCIRAEYLMMMEAIEHASVQKKWVRDRYPLIEDFPRAFQLLAFMRREPERSRRVLRIIYAHWLAHADDPPKSRPKMFETRKVGNSTYPDFPYYVPPGTRDAAHPLSSASLFAWNTTTLYGSYFAIRFPIFLPEMDRERVTERILTVTLAEQLYQREHGKLPAKAEDLVDAGYLKQLPEGYQDEAAGTSDAP